MTISSGLEGQRVLVTGASQGIGFGAAKAFLEEGASVVINSSNPEHLSKAEEELHLIGSVHSVAADITSKEGIDKLVSKTGKILEGIDSFVYVTGSPLPSLFMDNDYDDWEGAARLLMISPAYLARKVAEVMLRSRNGGRMVFLASVSVKEPIPNISTSNVCRIAIAGLVRTLARELGPKQIRVNGILPGSIRTGRTDQLAENIARTRNISKQAAISEMERQIPLGRIGSTEELASAIVFLGSEMSSYITGAMLPVDGGVLRSVL